MCLHIYCLTKHSVLHMSLLIILPKHTRGVLLIGKVSHLMHTSTAKPACSSRPLPLLSPLQALREIGFIVFALGKPLDPWLQKSY